MKGAKRCRRSIVSNRKLRKRPPIVDRGAHRST
jgi:hypothetical protein